jgi:hypothetical protein
MKKDTQKEVAKNQSLVDNSHESRNSKTGYKETNPAEIAAAARVRTYKNPKDSSD